MSRPSHHANDTGTAFRNPWPSATPPTWKDVSCSIPLSWYGKAPQLDRSPIKVVKPDWGASQTPSSEKKDCIVGTWLGHAGALVQLRPSASSPAQDRRYILFDPIFSLRAGPTQYTGPARFNQPPCKVADLPGCDAVCISHNHYDHLDTSTVLEILGRFPSAKWFVPLGIKSWLISTGFKAEDVMEMDWWDTWEGFTTKQSTDMTSFFRFSCVPAQHNSGRIGIDQASTLWCGWVVEEWIDGSSGKSRKSAVYHAGDTGYRRVTGSKEVCPAFKEIGDKFNGFDLSFIPIWRGGSLSWISYVGLRLHHNKIPTWNHCSPEDALLIHKDVKSRNTIAIHFGTFVGSQNESDEALAEFDAAVKADGLHTLDQSPSSGAARAGALNIGESMLFTPQ